MTREQTIARQERIAIMIESGISEEEADKYCDTVPEMYGTREWEQGDLVKF